MTKRAKFKAFTLIELLVAIAIIGTIIVVTTLAFSKIGENSRNSSRLADIQEIQLALEEYHKYESSYPEELIFGGPLIGPRSGKTFLTLLPQNPDPRNDGDCPDENYRYEHFPEIDSYHLYFCLGDEVSDLRSGPKIAKPSGIGEPPFVCENDFLDLRDGNSYPTVEIGEQCWMAKNLAYLPSVNNKSESSEDYPMYYVYDYDGKNPDEAKTKENYIVYGVLYNHPAAKISCPEGWHLPSDEEWYIMENFIDKTVNDPNATGWRGTDVGAKIKEIGTDHWVSDYGSTNSTKLTVLGAGIFQGSYFADLKLYTYFFTSTKYVSGSYIYYRGRRICAIHNDAGRSAYVPNYAISIRCLLD